MEVGQTEEVGRTVEVGQTEEVGRTEDVGRTVEDDWIGGLGGGVLACAFLTGVMAVPTDEVGEAGRY